MANLETPYRWFLNGGATFKQKQPSGLKKHIIFFLSLGLVKKWQERKDGERKSKEGKNMKKEKSERKGMGRKNREKEKGRLEEK